MKDRALLNVQLEVTPNTLFLKVGSRLAAKIRGVKPRRVHTLGECLARTHVHGGLQLAGPKKTQCRPAAQVSAVMPDKPSAAFLGADAHDRDVSQRLNAEVLQR